MEKDFSKHTVYGNFCSMDNRAFPIDCETLAALQSNAKKMAASALIAGCSRLILTGCKVSGSKRTEGYVFIVNADNPLTGEVIYHPEQTKADYCYIKEDPVLVEADGKKYPEAYDIRYIVDGRIDGAWAWSSFTNIADISNAALKEGLTNDINSKDAALRTLIEQKTTSSSVIFVSGMIMMWSGAANAIPSGWALCDGKNGRPNLIDKFVLGAGGIYTPKGGAISQSITLEEENLPRHSHSGSTYSAGSHSHKITHRGFYDCKGNEKRSMSFNTIDNDPVTASFTCSTEGNHTHDFVTDYTGSGKSFTVNTMPPYYALCFIIKL